VEPVVAPEAVPEVTPAAGAPTRHLLDHIAGASTSHRSTAHALPHALTPSLHLTPASRALRSGGDD
jgi:hypothetical protein